MWSQFYRKSAVSTLILLGFSFLSVDSQAQQPGHKEGWRVQSEGFPEPMVEPVSIAVGAKIYMIGGVVPNSVSGMAARGAVWEYDTTSEAWTEKKPMASPVHHFAADSFGGKIYVVGGFVSPKEGRGWEPVDAFWEYDPAIDSWRALSSAPQKRGAGQAVIEGGKLFYVGGAMTLPGSEDPAVRYDRQNDRSVGFMDIYDFASGEWSSAQPMPTPRNHFGLAAVNGKLYAIGGRSSSVLVTRSSNTGLVEEYNIEDGIWRGKRAMPTPRSGFAINTHMGRIYVGGGEVQTEKLAGAYRAFEIYDPETDSWVDGPRLPRPRHGFSGAIVDGELHYIGGNIQTDGLGYHVSVKEHDVFRFGG